MKKLDKIIQESIEQYLNNQIVDLSNVIYIGLNVNEESKNKLVQLVSNFIETNNLTDEYKFICHHMTVAFRTTFNEQVQEWINANEGKKYQLIGTEIGLSDKAIALKVETDCMSTNNLKHITLAVDLTNGGKPVDSNKIVNWQKIQPINLQGIVQCFRSR